MLEKPKLADEKILACLRDSYGLAAAEIEFLPLGYDANAGVYRVTANDRRYFLKAKADTVHELSVILPRYLKEHGLPQVVAPLPTISGDLWGKVDDFTLLLYPFIEEKSGALSDRQWIEFGEIVRKLHGTSLPPDLTNLMAKEDFVPNPRLMAVFRQFNAEVTRGAYESPFQNDLALFWIEHRQEMIDIVERSERLGQMLQGKSPEFVLCHADIHTGNLLIDLQDNLYVVDWDQPILAPRERDLMFAFWAGKNHEALFFKGYGSTDIDPLVMAYYRYTRLMEDIALFAESVFQQDASNETRQDAIKWIRWQFEPGNMVEAAHQLDDVLQSTPGDKSPG